MTLASTWRYEAARSDGGIEQGEVHASDRDAAAATIARRGLFLLELATVPAIRRRRMSMRDAAVGLGALANLLEAGMPVVRALKALHSLAPARWQPVIAWAEQRVTEGSGLTDALAESPAELPPLCLGIIRAGETGGDVAAGVRRAAAVANRSAEAHAALRSALTYPVLLAAAGSLTVVLLVVVVIPRFADILAELGEALPLSTRLLLTTAHIAGAVWLPLLVASGVAFALWRSWTASDEGRARWHELLLGAPVLGTLRLSSATAGTCTALGALLAGGATMRSALHATAASCPDLAVRRRILLAAEAVVAGSSLSGALLARSAVSDAAVHLIRLGEESGRTPALLTEAGVIEQQRVERVVSEGTRLIEPMLVVIFGGVVALVAAALLQAVYSVRAVP